MINRELEYSSSLMYLSDNSRRKFGKGHRHLFKCLEAVLLAGEEFLQKNSAIGGARSRKLGIEVSVTLCGSRQIRRLNRDFRHKDKATDVLSFPMHETLRSKNKVEVFNGRVNVGDIVVCRDVTLKQAHRFNISYEQELIHLLIHGFLHLCGFDHEVSAKEEKIMEAHEKQLVEKIYKKLEYI